MTEWTTREATDVESLRAVAHPLRVRLLASLRIEGPATASELGRRFDESSGSTSYHLRQLARYGYVEEDDEQPSRRERRWKATSATTSWDDSTFIDDPAGRAASDALSELQLQTVVRHSRRWRATRAGWPRRWVRAAEASDAVVRLTPAAARALAQEIGAVVRRYDAENADAKGAELVTVFWQVLPARVEDLR